MQKRLNQLDKFLIKYANLWRPQPYKQRRPQWCQEYPQLTQALLALNNNEVQCFEADNDKLLAYLSDYLPQLSELKSLCDFPLQSSPSRQLSETQFGWQIPGRKRMQIEAFSDAIGPVSMPVLEWCGGKGHLGRTLSLLWQQPVATIEWNQQLCEEGERLAKRANVNQVFYQQDAMSFSAQEKIQSRHVIALHACGDLHRQLVRAAVSKKAKAIDVSPCCYHHGKDSEYTAFNSGLQLHLTKDDLRLAVTNSTTASKAQLKLRDREMAWKLGFEILRQTTNNTQLYTNLKPIDKQWLKLDYSGFCGKLAEREGFIISHKPDWKDLENQAWQRQGEVMRLSLLRFAFRRALETWLVLDMACFLLQQGYDVDISVFCDTSLTPRNILLSARN